MTEDFGKPQHTRKERTALDASWNSCGVRPCLGQRLLEANINEARRHRQRSPGTNSNTRQRCFGSMEKSLQLPATSARDKNRCFRISSSMPATHYKRREIHLRTRAVGDRVLIEIQDTGCGIPPENLKRIFDPFFTTKPVGKRNRAGLWITATLAESPGGNHRAKRSGKRNDLQPHSYPPARISKGQTPMGGQPFSTKPQRRHILIAQSHVCGR